MKFNKVNQELQEKVVELLNSSEDKSKAIYEAIEMLNEAQHQDLIEQLQIENEAFKANSQLNEKLGLRAL